MMLSLVVAILAVPIGNQDGHASGPAGVFRELQREFDASLRDLDEAQAATTEQQRAEIVARFRDRARDLASRALELAREHPGDPASFDALIWVINKVQDRSREALEALARDHIDDSRLVEACRAARHAPVGDFAAAEALLRRAMARSPHREVRGFAGFYLAKELQGRAESLRRFERRPEEAERFRARDDMGDESFARFRGREPGDLEAEAGGLYERVIADYGDLPTLRKPALGEVARGELFDLRHLAVGREAPEIAGEDVDGRPLRLSDYRGQVVVLMFSGNWCGPCVRMYPQEREFVRRLRDEPFALLSVSSDKDKATLREAIDRGEITWRCWWDGGTDGPIALGWGIDVWPTIFVIDRDGVIRDRGHSGLKWDEAVEALLKDEPPQVR